MVDASVTLLMPIYDAYLICPSRPLHAHRAHFMPIAPSGITVMPLMPSGHKVVPTVEFLATTVGYL